MIRYEALPPGQQALMPNLFLIGAGKCGTTSLHAYLGQHPEITGARVKEPSFFTDKAELARRQLMEAMRPEANELDAYLALFAGGERTRYRMESNPTYTNYPVFTGVPERIAAASPRARLIYLVRNPVDRTISNYWHSRRQLAEPLPLRDALRPDTIYFHYSDYKAQLDRYRALFDDIIVVASEEMRDAPQATLRRITDRLGLAPLELDADALRERNRTAATTRQPRFPLVRRLRDTRAWNRVRDRLPQGTLEAIRALAVRQVPRDSADEAEVRRMLRDHFAPMVRAFDDAYATRLYATWFA